ncbi:MAG: hypothetical protein HOO96_03590 [Polyangiaceae bacterium]|nr:hypothetical protein [Polyangiaceae bacterium]
MSWKCLTGVEHGWAASVLDAMFPRGASLPLGIADMDVRGFLDRTFTSFPTEPVLGLRLTLWIIVFAPLLVLKRARLFPSLPRPEQERVLDALFKSPIYAVRQLCVALKATAALLYAGNARVRAAMTRTSGLSHRSGGASLVQLGGRRELAV